MRSPLFALKTSLVGELKMNGINPGDIVQLKSGGPKMTVRKVEVWNGVLEAVCDWFDEGKGQSQRTGFPVSSLKLVEE
jgi:uncharacterized protein YodC (DUF2158 family)